jgi:hypothetical protein
MAPAHESETIVFNFRKYSQHCQTTLSWSKYYSLVSIGVNRSGHYERSSHDILNFRHMTLWIFVTWHYERSSHDMNCHHLTLWMFITWHYGCSSHDMNVHHMTLWMFITWHHKCSSHDIINVRHMALGMFTYFFFIIFLYTSSFSYTCLLMTW